MRKSKFQDNAKPPGKGSAGDKTSTTATIITQPRPAATGPRPPAPKAPFGMHILPVAINIKPAAAHIVKKTEETAGDAK